MIPPSKLNGRVHRSYHSHRENWKQREINQAAKKARDESIASIADGYGFGTEAKGMVVGRALGSSEGSAEAAVADLAGAVRLPIPAKSEEESECVILHLPLPTAHSTS